MILTLILIFLGAAYAANRIMIRSRNMNEQPYGELSGLGVGDTEGAINEPWLGGEPCVWRR